MSDWKTIAQGIGLELSKQEWERIEQPLRALEEAFRPLVRDLPQGLDPATIFCAAPEDGQ